MLVQAFTPTSTKIYSDQAKKTDPVSDVVLFIIYLSVSLSYYSDFKSLQFRDCHECDQHTSTAVSCLQQKSNTDKTEFFSTGKQTLTSRYHFGSLCVVYSPQDTQNIILCLEGEYCADQI